MPHKDPAARRNYKRIWYLRNAEEVRENVTRAKRARRAQIRGLIAKIKGERGCNRCGEADPVCLDFHHLDPKQKRFSISSCGTAQTPFNDIVTEIQKCEVICANCHRKLHAAEQNIERYKPKSDK